MLISILDDVHDVGVFGPGFVAARRAGIRRGRSAFDESAAGRHRIVADRLIVGVRMRPNGIRLIGAHIIARGPARFQRAS